MCDATGDTCQQELSEDIRYIKRILCPLSVVLLKTIHTYGISSSPDRPPTPLMRIARTYSKSVKRFYILAAKLRKAFFGDLAREATTKHHATSLSLFCTRQ